MVGTNPTTLARTLDGVREFFLLERAEKKSEALTASQREATCTYHEAAGRRVGVARDLRGPVQTPAALLLYRQGTLFYVLAYLVSKDASLDPASLTAEEAFRKLDEAVVTDGLTPPKQFERARALLIASDPLALDRMNADEAGQRIEELEAVARWVAHLLDPRSPREIKTARVIRVLVGATAAIALIVNLGMRLFSAKNLALDKTAVGSSYMFSTGASGAVDGSRGGPYGFHSQLEESPWLSIDLGKAFAITEIKVFGRTDGYYDQSVPLALEVSDDATNYHQVATRAETFSDYDPWVFKPAPPFVTRYLRLRTMRRSYLVLGEVEVYGNDSKRN
jgi:hypothetical protein